MVKINSQSLFLTTSPRTPDKMIPEIELLTKHFDGKEWNKDTQTAFMQLLREEHFFFGKGEKDPALSARDRINRAPKALGFVKLSPLISLTPAGKALISSKRKNEVFLRQMLKFQLPSPYHKLGTKAASFRVKPYLEILRLVRKLGTLKFDELQIFGLQLTDWHDFSLIIKKINKFRRAKAINRGSYKTFKREYFKRELISIYNERISRGDIKTRESKEKSLEKFLSTQSNNMRDYADACFRYLRATGLVNVSQVGKSLSIVQERIADVDYILKNVDREPCFVNDEEKYISYLGDVSTPKLLTDNKEKIIIKLKEEFGQTAIINNLDISSLKDLLDDLTEERKKNVMNEQVLEIKDRKLYDDIQDTFNRIVRKDDLYDVPLMFEWNVWRAMTMLDGGTIKANLKFDDFGKPMSTASGNMSDIVCDYGDYMVSVEVTMASGQRQYEMEGEPVARHLGKLKRESGKPCYCLFIAPTINEGSVAHFFSLHKFKVSYYEGKSIIVPVPLDIFMKMLEDSYKSDFIPNSEQVKRFFEHSRAVAESAEDEVQWYEDMKKYAMTWLD